MSVPSIPPTGSVQSAIALASRKTGIDFNYLLGQAQVESGLRPNARAGTSSATGLYQFIDQSWLAVVKQHGAEHGLGWGAVRSEERRVGKECVSTCRSRWSRCHIQIKKTSKKKNRMRYCNLEKQK